MTIDSALRLIAGVFVLLSVSAAVLVDPRFLWLTAFVGVNLAQSAFSGWCPMMTILRKAGMRS